MSLVRKAATLVAAGTGSFVFAVVSRCGASRPLMDWLAVSLLVVVSGVALYWTARRRFWVLLVVPAALIGLVYGEMQAAYLLGCGAILCR